MKKILLSLLFFPIAFTLSAGLPCDGAIHFGLALNFSATATSQEIQASDFFVSLDPNCTELAAISFSATDVNETVKTFDCSILGTQFVDIFITDTNGNQISVSIFIFVQDQLGACPGPGSNFCQSNLVVPYGLAMALGNTNEEMIPVDKFVKRVEENCPEDYSVYFGDSNDTEINFNNTSIGSQLVTIDLKSGEAPINRVETYMIVQPPLSTTACIPVPIVYNGLAVSLDNTGIVELDAALFDAGSYNNCGGDFTFSFSTETTDTKRTFDCFYQGTQFVDIWITDTQTGNQNKVPTYVSIQDNQGVCPDPCPANPTVFNGLATGFSKNSATLQINARDFYRSLTGCLDFAKVSFSEDENDVLKTFDCTNLGTQPVDIFIHNSGVNSSVVSTYLFVQDHLAACESDITANCQSTLTVHNGLAMALSNTNSGTIQTSHLTKEAASACSGTPSVKFETSSSTEIQFDETTLGFQSLNLNLEMDNMLMSQVGTYVLVQPPLSTTTACIPVPIVYNALATTLMSSGTIQIEASIFDAGSYTDCGGGIVFSFSSDVMDTKRTFDCSNIGTAIVNIWITDTQTGTQNKVETYILINDASGLCQGECPTNTTFTPTSDIMTGTYSASDYINFQSIVDFSENLTLKAGNQITLLPGTHIQANSDFLATIEDCSATNFEEAAETSRQILPEQAIVAVSNNNALSISPNPFSGTTNIDYRLSHTMEISLAIYDRNGQLVEQILQNTSKDAGRHNFVYQADYLEAGMYFLVLQSEVAQLVKKIAVFR